MRKHGHEKTIRMRLDNARNDNVNRRSKRRLFQILNKSLGKFVCRYSIIMAGMAVV